MNTNYLNLVSYFGGKYPHLNWLIKQFPTGYYHFIDLLCGAANVALNVNYPLITVNDLNENIVNLFHVLRENSDEFISKLELTPFSRSELYRAIEEEDPACNIERARRYYLKCQLGYGANGSQNNHKGAGFEYKLFGNGGTKVNNWNNKLIKIQSIITKLRSMQIESRNALELFEKLSNPTNIIYADPPYLMSTRSSGKRYIHEQDITWHKKLLDLALASDSLVAISHYENTLYDNKLKTWHKIKAPFSRATVSKKEVQECLYTNYDINNFNNQTQLFHGNN